MTTKYLNYNSYCSNWELGIRNWYPEPVVNQVERHSRRVGIGNMTKIKLLFLIFIINLSIQSYAQISQNFTDDAGHFLDTGKELSAAIWNADGNDYINFALLSAGVLGISLVDKSMRIFAQDQQSSFNDKLFIVDRYYGNKWYMLGGMSAIYLGGLLSQNEHLRETGLYTAEAYFYTAVFTVITKEIFGRVRPYKNEGPNKFNPFSFKESRRSFFSGHSSTVFAVSTVMASRIDNLFWKIGWYTAASITAVARIYRDRHWLSDSTAGALVGHAIGNFVVNRSESKISLYPDISTDKPMMVGFSIQLN